MVQAHVDESSGDDQSDSEEQAPKRQAHQELDSNSVITSCQSQYLLEDQNIIDLESSSIQQELAGQRLVNMQRSIESIQARQCAPNYFQTQRPHCNFHA